MSLLTTLEADEVKLVAKIEAWFKKAENTLEADAVILEQDAVKVAVYITAKIEPEIEKLISNGTIILAEKVVDVITNSNVGDVIGAAIIADLPKIQEAALAIQKVMTGIPVIKTMFAAQIRAIINSESTNPQPLNWGLFWKEIQLGFEDLVADVTSVASAD